MTPERRQKKMSNLASRLRYQAMYPTPRASAAMNENLETIRKRNKYNGKLEEKVALMYPTPTPTQQQTKYKQGGTPLTVIVQQQEGKVGGKLSPNFVEFLMGYTQDWTKIEQTELKHSETQ